MSSEVTRILYAIDHGDPDAAEELLPLVYDELRKLADARLAAEKPGQTLQATALVHEAYLRLIGPESDQAPAWDHRGHFFAAAAEAMRRILIDRARARGAVKRGGGRPHLSLDDLPTLVAGTSEERLGHLLDLDRALARLESEDEQKAQLVKLRFFAGLTLRQAAELLGISPATADRHWAYARAFLYSDMRQP